MNQKTSQISIMHCLLKIKIIISRKKRASHSGLKKVNETIKKRETYKSVDKNMGTECYDHKSGVAF